MKPIFKFSDREISDELYEYSYFLKDFVGKLLEVIIRLKSKD